ncbi:S-adenosyl-L-methionine-dependent methyltransferase [Mycena sanguinolenta]|uniref:S-adenosyl-L-methionine-dependent methyltransferase n=1 Tax=Mycena sanguinolenta TaxID=230812 RepID=A0A8H7DJL6_9AGAR|nr:S-adenosyl-L-methionine-dependent methyltransferase [Mycena sanguinolenta]
MPDRSLPPNITFQLADLAQKLDFEDQMFDIVHARWVMVHACLEARKARGLLLIEDGHLVSFAESGGPATRRVFSTFNEIQKGLGVDVELGRKIKAIITSLNNFSDIQVPVPFGTNGSDEALNQLGLVIRNSAMKFYKTISQRMHDQGLTHDLIWEFEEEMEGPDNESVVDISESQEDASGRGDTSTGGYNRLRNMRHTKPAVDSERLDELHIKVARYLGNKLGPAPLDGLRPSKILELGCGSGAWAIQAATQFPNAEVVAVDQSPLPDRNLEGPSPPNITFQLADLAQRLNFEDQMFDIVHSRWVMSHVSTLVHTSLLDLKSDTKLVDGAATIRRVSRLVKPGGLLLIEDTDLVSLAESGGPATRQLLYKYKEIQNALGADTELGRKIEAIITSLGDFSDIQVKKLSIPFSANGPGKGRFKADCSHPKYLL